MTSAPHAERVKIGVQLQPQHCTYAEYARAWLTVDEMGVDSVWNWDHFFPLWGEAGGPHFEGWTLLAALGAQTKRAQVGCLVLSMSYRNPALLANMAKTLDHVTGGRLILGLGAGWFERDYREYGYTFGTAADRLRNLERGIIAVKERWQRDNPRPLRGSVPILVGGGGEKVTLRITAQHADLWNSFGPLDTWRRKSGILDEWCARVGRDPRAVERTVALSRDSLGSAEAFAQAGADSLILQVGAPFDLKPVQELLAWRDRYRAA